MQKSVCVFCGSRSGNIEVFSSESKKLADLFIDAGFDLVYGGGQFGLMGVIASRFLKAGRKVYGIRPSFLIEGEGAFLKGVEQVVVPDMFERKRQMLDAALIFIALPGGIGTLDEIGDVYTQVKLGYTNKFCGVLNVDGYYQPLAAMLQNMVDNEFLTDQQQAQLVMHSKPEELFNTAYQWWKSRAIIDKVAYISLKKGQLLMTRSRGKAKYYLPAGKRELGEVDHETLIREVKEELAVSILKDSIAYLGTFAAQADGAAPGVQVQLKCYEAKYDGQLMPANEIEEIRWMNYHEIDLVAEVDKKIFNFLKAQDRLK